MSAQVNHVFVGDFNGDHRADIVSANGSFDEWLGNADGTVRWASAAAPTWCKGGAAGCLSTVPGRVVVGDFNGDGLTDFLSANGSFDEWLSALDGSLQWTVTAAPYWCQNEATNCLSTAANHIIVGDFNGDGMTDFLSADGQFDVWLANADRSGTFTWTTSAPPSWCSVAADCISTLSGHVVVGDFNKDGCTDFMSANGQFDVWLSNCDGTFRWTTSAPPSWCPVASDCLSTSAGRVIVGDFNGDGATDFLSANGKFDEWLANGDGTFRWVVSDVPSWCTTAANCLSTLSGHVVVGDFNGDHRTDIISANGSFDAWLGNPDGTLTWTGSKSPSWCPVASQCWSTKPGHVVVGDFNGDGRDDVISADAAFDAWLGKSDGSLVWSPTNWGQNGTACTSRDDCCGGACVQGKCTTCTPPNQSPTSGNGDQCCAGEGYRSGVCFKPCPLQVGDPCTVTSFNGVPVYGMCQKGTVTVCDNFGNNVCQPGKATPELCNHLDDDCDGKVDNLTGSCTAFAPGGCNVPGHNVCGGPGYTQTCQISAGVDYCTDCQQVVNGASCGVCSACTTSAECPPNYICAGAPGQTSCRAAPQCSEATCWLPSSLNYNRCACFSFGSTGGTCGGTCFSAGSPCSTNQQCCSGACDMENQKYTCKN